MIAHLESAAGLGGARRPWLRLDGSRANPVEVQAQYLAPLQLGLLAKRRRQLMFPSEMLAFVPDCRAVIVVRHQHPTVVGGCAVKQRSIIAGDARVCGVKIRAVRLPYRDPLQSDDGGAVIFRARHLVVFAGDGSVQSDVARHSFRPITNPATGQDIAAPVLPADTEQERTAHRGIAVGTRGTHRQLRGGKPLPVMRREMICIAGSHEAGIGFPAGWLGRHPDIESVGLSFASSANVEFC